MSILAVLVMAAVVGLAAAFVAWPAWRTGGPRARILLAGAAALFVAGLGTGAYLMVGSPYLALRAMQGADTSDIDGLIALLVRHVHEKPQDGRAWVFLGRAYLTVGDNAQAAGALARAIDLAEKSGQAGAELYSAYGEALVNVAHGAVSPDAEAAFAKAIARDPKDRGARYYLGLAAAARGDRQKALALWQSLLADAAPDAPYRRELVDRIAQLGAQTGVRPDVAAMVEQLAARLKIHPADADGWLRLVRSYAVLGRKDRALSALGDARRALAENPKALSALAAEARDLKLEN